MISFSRRLSVLFAILLITALSCTGACSSKRAQPASAAAPPIPSSTETAAATVAVLPPPSAEAESKDEPGAIITAPSNIRRFSPKETGLAAGVPADQLDLRKVFEELGPDTTLWYQHVQTLANPFFGGRAPGTRGDELAAEYVEHYFKSYNLEPAFPELSKEKIGDAAIKEWASYRQPFDFASPNPNVKVIEATASLNADGLNEKTDFVVLGNSGNGEVTAPITFVGYGIEEGRDGYTSFEENADLTGRIALLMRYEPLNEEGKSQWSQARFSGLSSISAKFKNVIERGAAAVILVNPPGAVDGKEGLESLRESGRFGRRLSIPAIQISPGTAERIFAAGDAEQRDFMIWRKLADRGEIKTAKLDDALKVTIKTDLEVNDRIATQNVGGVVRGKGSLADEWIVIGAHMDHVGYGYTGTMPQNIGKLHPGADDNGSGTAGLLVAAKRLSEHYASAGDEANLRSIMFIGFGAEEAGLIGSKHFVEEPPISLGAINLMLNMDMIGRLRNNSVLVQGTGTAEQFGEALKPIFESSGLKIAAHASGRGPSDHSSFYGKNIPVLFLFTGEHRDYHQPSDFAYTVNPAGAIKVVDLMEKLALHFATSVEKLHFMAPGPASRPDAAPAADAAPARQAGVRVSLGTMPDYMAELETGVRVDDVRAGSAADEAGIRAGDILLTWNGEELTGAAKLMEFLGKHEPGDRVKVMLRRDKEEVAVEVVLKPRATPQQ